MMAMRRIGSKVLGVLLAAVLIAGTFGVALADGPVGPTGTPLETASPAKDQTTRRLKATYDETQPGADDPRVKEGFAAYQAGDFKKAYDIWLPLAKAGNAEAQFRIGRLYDFGELEPRHRGLGVQWYWQAIENGHRTASYNLGLLYSKGQVVNKDYNIALRLIQIAAERGEGDYNLCKPT